MLPAERKMRFWKKLSVRRSLKYIPPPSSCLSHSLVWLIPCFSIVQGIDLSKDDCGELLVKALDDVKLDYVIVVAGLYHLLISSLLSPLHFPQFLSYHAHISLFRLMIRFTQDTFDELKFDGMRKMMVSLLSFRLSPLLLPHLLLSSLLLQFLIHPLSFAHSLLHSHPFISLFSHFSSSKRKSAPIPLYVSCRPSSKPRSSEKVVKSSW